MKLTITNKGRIAFPLAGAGWSVQLEPGIEQTIDQPDSPWLLGDKAGDTYSIMLSITNGGAEVVRLVSNGGTPFDLAPAASSPVFLAVQFVEFTAGAPPP